MTSTHGAWRHAGVRFLLSGEGEQGEANIFMAPFASKARQKENAAAIKALEKLID